VVANFFFFFVFSVDFLGHTSIKISEILEDGQGPWTKRQLLENVHTGEIEFLLEYHQIGNLQ